MLLYLKLFVAHIIGDFVFQPERWVLDKKKNKIKSKKLYLHIAVHTILLLILLQFNAKYIGGLFLIISTHFLIDVGKVYFQTNKNKRWLFFIDQTLHLFVLVVVTYIYYPFSIKLKTILTEKNLLLLASVLFVTYASSVIIKIIITQWNPENKAKGDSSLEKAGRYIGILERLFVFFFVITANWSGIGFLLGAKSIFRFGDLTASKDRKLTEYVLIGTLLSFAFAIFTGMIYLQLI